MNRTMTHALTLGGVTAGSDALQALQHIVAAYVPVVFGRIPEDQVPAVAAGITALIAAAVGGIIGRVRDGRRPSELVVQHGKPPIEVDATPVAGTQ